MITALDLPKGCCVKFSDSAKSSGCLTLGVVIFLGYSALVQYGEHQYERAVITAMKSIPLNRQVSSFQKIDIVNPVSWIWPARSTLLYASPDASSEGRFFTMRFSKGEKLQPTVSLIAPDCSKRNYVTYRRTESGDPKRLARDGFGDPLVAPDGKMFERQNRLEKLSDKLFTAFCKTSWVVG